MSPPSSAVDALLSNLNRAAENEQTDTDKAIALKKLEFELEERRAQRGEQERVRADERAGKSKLMEIAISVLGPAVVAMLTKPAIAPELMAMLMNNKGNGAEETKNWLEMQRAQSDMQLQTMLKGMMGFMELKDNLNQKLLDRAMENGDGGEETGVLGWLDRLGKVATPVLERMAAKPVEVVAANPALPAQAAPRGERKKPVVVILETLVKIHGGTLSEKQARVAVPSMVSVILQDEGLTAALLDDNQDTLISFCKPYIVTSAELVEWIRGNTNGAAHVEWLVNFIQTKLVPRVRAEVENEFDDDGSDDDGDKQNTTAGG